MCQSKDFTAVTCCNDALCACAWLTGLLAVLFDSCFIWRAGHLWLWQFFLAIASFGVPDTCDYGSSFWQLLHLVCRTPVTMAVLFGNCFIWRACHLGLWQFFLTVASFGVPAPWASGSSFWQLLHLACRTPVTMAVFLAIASFGVPAPWVSGSSFWQLLHLACLVPKKHKWNIMIPSIPRAFQSGR